MEVLGHRFETRFYIDDKRLLCVRAGGDPFPISEGLAPLAIELAAAVGKGADYWHRARRELLSFHPRHPGDTAHFSDRDRNDSSIGSPGERDN
jgi:hypothetical protein